MFRVPTGDSTARVKKNGVFIARVVRVVDSCPSYFGFHNRRICSKGDDCKETTPTSSILGMGCHFGVLFYFHPQ